MVNESDGYHGHVSDFQVPALLPGLLAIKFPSVITVSSRRDTRTVRPTVAVSIEASRVSDPNACSFGVPLFEAGISSTAGEMWEFTPDL